ncbi:tyrosine-type recombinase/integrase [Planctellipticum variicoloris]|uniref:tyrosine-type recombinase/integrase n=1 Tax=Planctellipticum variicoloris TaxID=3064265 RepID=UPI003AF697F2
MAREKESTRYCWNPDEFRAMLEHCRMKPDLNWLGNILLTLGLTGMRISELAQLCWSDVDLEDQQIRLVDESRRGRRQADAASGHCRVNVAGRFRFTRNCCRPCDSCRATPTVMSFTVRAAVRSNRTR